MKKALVLGLALLLFGGAPAMAGQFGPAQPVAGPGEFSLGTGLFYYAADWDGEIDATQTQGYVQFGYGLLSNTEIYAQLGVANLEIDDIELEDGYRPFGTVGVKTLFLQREPVSLGAFLQGSYFADYEDNPAGNKVSIESMYEINGGLAFQALIEGAILYGGPVLYYREADASVNANTGSVEEDGNFGAFVGIRWPLKNRMAIELETQFKTGVSVGGAVHYVF